MPDRLRARVALTALLVLLTIAGIRAVGPAVGLSLPSRPVVIAIGGILEAVLAGLLVALRWRGGRAGGHGEAAGPGSGYTASTGYAASTGYSASTAQAAGTPHAAGAHYTAAPGYTTPVGYTPASAGIPIRSSAATDLPDLGARIRPWLNGALITGLIAIPVLVLLNGLSHTHSSRTRPPIQHFRRPRLSTQRPTSPSSFRIDFHDIEYVLFAVLLIALIVLAIVIWRERWQRPAFDELDDEVPDTPAELARAVHSGRQALRELDDSRAAIIRCYVAMEQSLAQAGAARGAAETPDELLARAVAEDLVSGTPAGRLTALFYEARFSTHPMPASRRDDAEQALAELAATLGSGAATGASSASTSTASTASSATTAAAADGTPGQASDYKAGSP